MQPFKNPCSRFSQPPAANFLARLSTRRRKEQKVLNARVLLDRDRICGDVIGGLAATGTIDYRVRGSTLHRDKRFLGKRVSGSPGRVYCSCRSRIAANPVFFLTDFEIRRRVSIRWGSRCERGQSLPGVFTIYFFRQTCLRRQSLLRRVWVR